MLSSPRRSPASDEMTARSVHLPSYRSIPLRPLTGAMPPWPLKHQHDQGCNDHHPDQGVRWWSWWSRWVGHRCSRNMRAQAQS